jgi:hypothetical protein
MEYLFMLTELQQMACPSPVLRLPIYFWSDVAMPKYKVHLPSLLGKGH